MNFNSLFIIYRVFSSFFMLRKVELFTFINSQAVVEIEIEKKKTAFRRVLLFRVALLLDSPETRIQTRFRMNAACRS